MRRLRLLGLLCCLVALAFVSLSFEGTVPAARSGGRTTDPARGDTFPAAAQPGDATTGGASSGPAELSPQAPARWRSEPGRPAPPSSLTGYVWPLPHGRLTQPFGPSPWGSLVVDHKLFHDGIDLATFCGDRVAAAHAGVVLAAGYHYDTFMGWAGDLTPYLERLDQKGLWTTLPIVVVIDDGNGYRSVYAHFSRVVVKPGQVVRAGQELGLEGRRGHATGCHLHYGLFSPLETDTFAVSIDLVTHLLVPQREIARIDPLLVLPQRSDLDRTGPKAGDLPASVGARFE